MKQVQAKQLKYDTMLVTGGAGFIGSNMAISFKRKYPSLRIFALDNLKRRGSELNIGRLRENGIEFIHGDIRNPEDLRLNTKIDVLFECSAEPSVLAGYGGSPEYSINTNLVGTINCLELARSNNSDMIFFSTSRVYSYDALNSIKVAETEMRHRWSKAQERDIQGWSENGIDVGFTLNGPKSMYGATKLCSEIILQEYISMYGIKGIINRCGVIGGQWQFGKIDQGVFTLWMLAHYFKKELKYIGFGGKGKQVRDLLHVDDLVDLVDLQLASIDKANGKVYNVGGGVFANLSLCETTDLCREITGNEIKMGSEAANRSADVIIYISDNSRVSKDFFWKPTRTTKKVLEDIYYWIKKNEKDILRTLS